MHDEHYLNVFGRLKAGVTTPAVQGKLDAVAVRLRHDFRTTTNGQLRDSAVSSTSSSVTTASGC